MANLSFINVVGDLSALSPSANDVAIPVTGGVFYQFDGVNWNVHVFQSNMQPVTVGGGGGSGITQLTGDVVAGPGSGSQAATLRARTSDPGSPADLSWWLFTSASTPPASLELRVRLNGVTYAVPLGTVS